MAEEGGNQGAGGDQGSGDQKIKVGEKEYTPEDIQGLLSQTSQATAALQRLSVVEQAAARYGLSVEDYVKQADGGLSVVGDLLERGVIDQEGNLVTRKQQSEQGGDGEDDLMKLLQGDQQTAKRENHDAGGQMKAMLQALQEIKGTIDPLKQEIDSLKQDNAALLRHAMVTKLKGELPDLSDEEANEAIVKAQRDRSKGLAEHAKAILGKKSSLVSEAQLKLAKELGVVGEQATVEDLTQHLNGLKQQDPSGGAASLAKGKKFSFRPSAEAKDVVTPGQAANEYFRQQFGR